MSLLTDVLLVVGGSTVIVLWLFLNYRLLRKRRKAWCREHPAERYHLTLGDKVNLVGALVTFIGLVIVGAFCRVRFEFVLESCDGYWSAVGLLVSVSGTIVIVYGMIMQRSEGTAKKEGS